MLLKISTTHQPATDLGYLLHKHPDRVQDFEMSFGRAKIFYPEANRERCTAALLLDVDPIDLVRGKGQNDGLLTQYVNDRPYVASSLLSVAISRLFRTAMNGECANLPDLVETPIPLSVEISAVPCRGGEKFLRSLFEPLGYNITARKLPLDEQFPQWGESVYYCVNINQTIRLADLLCHLYVLIPVLDDEKHYWVGEEEVNKLLRRGSGWLDSHPAKEAIANRYLKRRRNLTEIALARLSDGESEETDEPERDTEEAELERPISLNQQRLEAIVATLEKSSAKTIVDLGCGEGNLIRAMLKTPSFMHNCRSIIGMDVSPRCLEIANRRLKLERLPPSQQEKVRLLQGSLTYRDDRLADCDAACAIEVIEHLDLHRLHSFERVLFEFAKPKMVIVSTPNREYNVNFPNLLPGKFRHRDHRFEWTRKEFQDWGNRVAKDFGYRVSFHPIGNIDSFAGSPTQMAVFVGER
jgi:3' terminal RNA ribose 2'-O-methyltransferase Hen1